MSLPSSGGFPSQLKKSGNVLFLGVARVKDKALVACLAPQRGQVEDAFLPQVREVLGAPDFSRKIQPGARVRLAAGFNAFSFTSDEQQRVYMVITTNEYPERLAFKMLNELVLRFKDLAAAALTCQPGALDGKAKKIFQGLVSEWDDPTKVDKLSLVQEQVQGVTQQMQTNVGQMMRNVDMASGIEAKSKELEESAVIFNKQSSTLRRMEQCRNYKYTAMIVCVVVLVVVILVLSLVLPAQQAHAAAAPAPAPAPSPTPPPSS